MIATSDTKLDEQSVENSSKAGTDVYPSLGEISGLPVTEVAEPKSAGYDSDREQGYTWYQPD
ncbi:hypothetical protein K0M31_012592 [Melipona bicolor]|uniref:Uncharacterized protein n=1 Tax=Melipona bicolor TaxID=60889 RepID=A0AA40FJZ2_9HYME|nr:hypothetical protein K0M31_012592 [Melipona bicolor]